MKNLFFLVVCIVSAYAEQIHVVFTSALIPEQYELRKTEYVKSLNQIRSLGLDPWVIEATHIHTSFYDGLTKRVFYPNTNDSSLRNKGVNELASLRACLSQLPFADEDIVIKLTGRYFLNDNMLIQRIQATQSHYDVWGLFGKHFVTPGHLVTGCFAMRWKFLKEIINSIDLAAAEKDYVAVEKLIAEEIVRRSMRVDSLKELHLSARIFFSGPDAAVFEF